MLLTSGEKVLTPRSYSDLPRLLDQVQESMSRLIDGILAHLVRNMFQRYVMFDWIGVTVVVTCADVDVAAFYLAFEM
jgi:DNA segregation ATPase FtsK/SpoIIIE-like protein